MIVVSGGGGGSRSYLKFNKDLHSRVGKTINELEGIFHQVFSQIAYFQEELDFQQGKAAASLKRNVNHHLKLMGKSAPVLLHFTDVMKSLMATIEATDEESSNYMLPVDRQEWSYSLSVERVADEVNTEASSMKLAAAHFQGNVAKMDDIFSSFNTLVNEIISDTNLPWDDFATIWSDAQQMVESIMEETKDHIEKLSKEAELFAEEMMRVDLMTSQLMGL